MKFTACATYMRISSQFLRYARVLEHYRDNRTVPVAQEIFKNLVNEHGNLRVIKLLRNVVTNESSPCHTPYRLKAG